MTTQPETILIRVHTGTVHRARVGFYDPTFLLSTCGRVFDAGAYQNWSGRLIKGAAILFNDLPLSSHLKACQRCLSIARPRGEGMTLAPVCHGIADLRRLFGHHGLSFWYRQVPGCLHRYVAWVDHDGAWRCVDVAIAPIAAEAAQRLAQCLVEAGFELRDG